MKFRLRDLVTKRQLYDVHTFRIIAGVFFLMALLDGLGFGGIAAVTSGNLFFAAVVAFVMVVANIVAAALLLTQVVKNPKRDEAFGARRATSEQAEYRDDED